jgi:hypothetical protein
LEGENIKKEPTINDSRIIVHKILSKAKELTSTLTILHTTLDEDINCANGESIEKLATKDVQKCNLRFEMHQTAEAALEVIDKAIESAKHLKSKLV